MAGNIDETLRERGLRVTPQRVRIWEVLAGSGGHLTAEEVWREVSRVLPGLELSTVYRSLDALCDAGLVVESRPPEGPRLFEARGERHPHLVCRECGGVFHPEREAERRLVEVLGEVSGGFEVEEVHLVAVGVCSRCSGEEAG